MLELLTTIALLCQATPTASGHGTSVYSKEVRNSQAACQQRLLKCVKKGSILGTQNLVACVEDGEVFDK